MRASYCYLPILPARGGAFLAMKWLSPFAESRLTPLFDIPDAMGLFDLFRRPKPAARSDAEWFDVAANLSGTLWIMLHEHPEMLANPYARVVLFESWSMGIACDKPPPDKILGKGQISFVFLREDENAYENWIKGLRAIPDEFFQKIETETFAKVLVRKLAQTVQVVD